MKLKEIFIRAKNCTSYNEFKRKFFKEFWGKDLTPSYSKAMEKIIFSFDLPIEQDENKLEKIVQRIRKENQMKQNKTQLTQIRITPQENELWNEQSLNKSELIRDAVNHYILFVNDETKKRFNYEFVTVISKYPDGKEESNICVFLDINGTKYEIWKRGDQWCCEEIATDGEGIMEDGFCSMNEAIQYLLMYEN